MAKKNLTLEEKLEEAIVKDGPYEVPGNWIEIFFESILSIEGGTQPPKSQFVYEPKDGYIRLYQIRDFSSENYHTYVENTRKLRIMSDGDIMIARYGASIGKIFMARKGAYNVALAKLIYPNELYNINFLYWYLKSDLFQNRLGDMSRTAVAGFNKNDLKDFIIPLPPLKEQQRIVNRIESLFEKLDKAKELIEEAREGFEKRKSAVLVKAFTGELTEKWRRNNYINNYELLDNIINENKKIKKNFNLTASDKLYKIPNSWTWIKLKDICEKFKYGTSAKSQPEGNIPVLRMGNLQQGKLVWDSLVYTSDEDEINKYDLIKGDLLFNRTNSPELVGKTSIYDGEMKAIFAGYLIRVRALSGIHSKYINYFMNSVYAKARCMEVKSDGVSQSNINAEKLGDFDIPLPSSEEQNEVVRILDKILEEEAKIKELTQLEDQIELIKKSILAKAFRGELGTNCEEDESALELLKEILNKI